VVCLAALLSCSDRGSASSSPGEGGAVPLVAADATVGGAMEDGSPPEAGVVITPPPDSGLSTGPDGAAPVPCDVDAAPATQCRVAPTDCTNDAGGVLYTGGWCVSGTCNWLAQPFTCRGGDTGNRCAPPGASQGEAVIDDAGTWVVSEGCLQPVPPAPPPPQVSCTAGSGDAALCPPPRSACLDSAWLVYYDQGECVAGQCSWQVRYGYCGGNGCVSGACVFVATPQ
jgi:hypothetical protein